MGNCLGKVPEAVPKVPLLIDVERQQKRLRVPFTAEIKEMTLDLRKETDLERSLFFHRLALLDIDWPSRKPQAARVLSRKNGVFTIDRNRLSAS